MDSLREDVISKMRSCLISSKGKSTVKQLADDYRVILGETIPLSRLGYKTLPDFISSVPSLILSKGLNGEYLVDAKVSEKSAHISKMVQKQKTKKKTSNSNGNNKFRRMNRREMPTNNKKPSQRWRPKNVSTPIRYKTSTRPAEVFHNQFVNSPKIQQQQQQKVHVPSKIVVPETSLMRTTQVAERLAVGTKSISPPVTISANNTSIDDNNESNDPLTSTKKRLSQLMKEISLESKVDGIYNISSDSTSTINNHSPTMKLLKTEQYKPSGDVIEDLNQFANIHNLGEVSWNKYFMEKSSKTPTCKVKIGEKHWYSSYPNKFKNELQAKQYTAKKALDDLISKYDNIIKKSLPVSSCQDILQRIPPMLQKHAAGIWAWQLTANYIDKYNEQLPTNWCEIVDSCPYVSIQDSGGVILVYYKADNIFQKELDLSSTRIVSDVSVAAKTIDFSSDERLCAIITSIISAGEIWCQQIDTKEYQSFLTMVENMELFYNKYKHEFKPIIININCYYVVKKDDVYCRAKALEINDDGSVKFILIDYGSDYIIPNDDIYQLRREFTIEDAQAFVFRLVGLENLYDVSIDSEHLQNLLWKVVVLELASEYSKEDDVILPVVMYDVEGASLNAKLIKDLTFESATPVLEKAIVNNVHVTNIEDNGDIYIQIRGPGYTNLEELMVNLTDEMQRNSHYELLTKITENNSKERLYLIKYKVNSKWRRTKIIDWSPITNNLVQIYFIDYGNTDVIDISEEQLYPLDKLDDVINQYPAQAIKVKMMLERLPVGFAEMVSKLISIDDLMIMNVAKFDDDNIALVDFYKRLDDGGLFCINKSIAIEAELRRKYVTNNNAKSSRTRVLMQFNEAAASKSVPSGGTLDEPILPKSDEFFNVNIPFAVSPWNFFVQPLSSFMKLTQLMIKLQERYEGRKFVPLKIEDIVRGQIYASRYIDGRWYRTSVLKVIHQGSISVCYCDFGYYTNLSIQQLVPLDVEFTKLPYQALKAKLAGVKPKEGTWSMEGCDYFKGLVTKRPFVSIVVSIEKDELYRSDNVLKMILIDTSTDRDKNISDELIEKGIAIKE